LGTKLYEWTIFFKIEYPPTIQPPEAIRIQCENGWFWFQVRIPFKYTDKKSIIMIKSLVCTNLLNTRLKSKDQTPLSFCFGNEVGVLS